MEHTEVAYRAIGYIRVSTSQQAEHGRSLEAQATRIRKYCEVYTGFELIEIIEDAGKSAATMNRPGFQRALGMLAAGEVDTIIVSDLSRLCRSVRDFCELLDTSFKRDDRNLVVIDHHIDTTSTNGRMMAKQIMLLFEWERELAAERIRKIMAHKRNLGEHHGGDIPYGFKLGKDRKMLQHCSIEMEVVSMILRWSDEGTGVTAICTQLTQLGITPRGKQWYRKTIYRMFERFPRTTTSKEAA